MQGTRRFVRISICWELWCGRISSFKSTFLHTISLRISNWKITLHKIKQLYFLWRTMRIYVWSQYLQKLVSVWAICRFILDFFVYQNFSWHRKAKLLCRWIALVLQVKFCFIGCLVKANALVSGNKVLLLSSQLIVLVFKKQPFTERYLANIFSLVFLWTFRKF